ncbi:MAG: hypothetical protein ABJC13_07585 [Acidobacteriota bacterium]
MPSNPNGLVLSNWHMLFEGFSTSTQDFYAAVEQAVRERNLPEISMSRERFKEGGVGTAEREYLRVRRKRIAFDICSAPYGGGHFFSWWLARVPPRFGILVSLGIFFVAACVTGILLIMTSLMRPDGLGGVLVALVIPYILYAMVLLSMGYLMQEGLIGDEEGVMMLPIIGRLYVFFFNPLTYYRLDTAMMFRDSVRSAVNEVINDLREEKGLRRLGDEELRPDADEAAATA